MNWKQIGDRGQNCAIGHLSRYGLGIAYPLSDNYPFDFIAITDKKLFKVQVKSSSSHQNGAVHFDVTTNNFYTGEKFKYTEEDCDIIACYDLRRDCLYILDIKDFKDRSTITIRFEKARNGQTKTCNFHDDLILSKERIKKLFDFDCPSFEDYFSLRHTKTYKRKCKHCNKSFETIYRKQKHCSSECNGISQRKADRPTVKQLREMIIDESLSFVAIGKKYGVSDTSVKKWIRSYGELDLLKAGKFCHNK